jgi:equilibrative nucleoside transporter 1/2/3
MDRIRSLMARPTAYEPINEFADDTDGTTRAQRRDESQFSRLEYGIFFLLGISMLWAW